MLSIFFIFLTLKILIQLYLSVRNSRYVTKNKNQVPKPFEGKISIEEHQKAYLYTVTNAKTSRFFLAIDLAILIFWLLGGLNKLDSYMIGISSNEMIRGIIFFLSFSFINLILGLPESIFHTFYIEEKFGFNKTTPKIFVADLFKQILLSLIIAPPLIALILWIMGTLGDYWWFFAFISITLFQFFMMLIYPMFIAPLFNKFTTLPEGELKDKILTLLKTINLYFKNLYVMDASKRSSHGNAYFTGFGKSKRIVLFDTLLNTLEPNEAVAVLAHELGHFKKKHILKGMIVSILFSLIGFYILGVLFKTSWFTDSFFIETKSTYITLLLFTLISPIFTFFLTPIFSYFSRKNEFEADDFAKTYSSGSDLSNALIKLYKDNASTLTPDPIYSAFYFSHPPALERIKNLTRKPS